MRQRFAKGLGGTLRLLPSEIGVASAATVSIRTSLGAEMPVPVVGQAATIDAGTGALSFVLVAANTPDPLSKGNLYRAVWAYTIDSVQHQTDQLFEVNQRLLKPVVRTSDVEPVLPAAWDQLLEDGEAAALLAVETGWADLLDDLVAKGFVCDRIMDPERLRQAHRAKVIALLYGSFGPDWLEAAKEARSLYQGELDALAASVGWYDVDQDVKGTDVETKVHAVVLTR